MCFDCRLLYLSATQYRYSNANNGLDGFDRLNSHNPIRHASTRPIFEFEPGGGRYERAVGTTAQIQTPDRVSATNQVQSPLHSFDDDDSTPAVPEEIDETNTTIDTSSSKPIIGNEVPVSHPRQDESRLLKQLLTNYDKRVRPILDAKKNITIYVGITLTQIFDMVGCINIVCFY